MPEIQARDRRRDDCEWRPGSAALRRLGNTQRGCGNDGQHQNDDSAEHLGIMHWDLGFGIWGLGFGVSKSVAAAR